MKLVHPSLPEMPIPSPQAGSPWEGLYCISLFLAEMVHLEEYL